jgi:hypothetical protein
MGQKIAGMPVDVVAIDMPMSSRQIVGRRVADQVVSKAFGRFGGAVHTFHQLRRDDAAPACARIGDRLGSEHCALERLGRADVGLWRSGRVPRARVYVLYRCRCQKSKIGVKQIKEIGA